MFFSCMSCATDIVQRHIASTFYYIRHPQLVGHCSHSNGCCDVWLDSDGLWAGFCERSDVEWQAAPSAPCEPLWSWRRIRPWTLSNAQPAPGLSRPSDPSQSQNTLSPGVGPLLESLKVWLCRLCLSPHLCLQNEIDPTETKWSWCCKMKSYFLALNVNVAL